MFFFKYHFSMDKTPENSSQSKKNETPNPVLSDLEGTPEEEELQPPTKKRRFEASYTDDTEWSLPVDMAEYKKDDDRITRSLTDYFIQFSSCLKSWNEFLSKEVRKWGTQRMWKNQTDAPEKFISEVVTDMIESKWVLEQSGERAHYKSNCVLL